MTTVEYDNSLPSMPKPFDGTQDEAIANYKTHAFRQWTEDEFECDTCMSKPWHTAALYPCGTHVPRINNTPEKIEREQRFRVAVFTAMRKAAADETPF